MSSNKSNSDFNTYFVANMKKQQTNEHEKEQQELQKLNENNNNDVHNNSIYDMLIGINDTFFGMLNDIITLNIGSDFFIKNNRMFYVGILLIIIAVFMLVYNHFYEMHFYDVLTEINTNKKNNKIVNVYNIYSDKKSSLNEILPDVEQLGKNIDE
jgi:hypothetical protein